MSLAERLFLLHVIMVYTGASLSFKTYFVAHSRHAQDKMQFFSCYRGWYNRVTVVL